MAHRLLAASVRTAAAVFLVGMASAPVAGQWLRVPVAGTPRTADGKPDLAARAPTTADGKPDLSGIWVVASGKYLGNLAVDGVEVPFKPEAAQLVILFEPFIDYRQIFTDGRSHPKDPVPTWIGYSVGRWDKDTLIVDSTGFNDRTWLDDGGHPHSDALHVTERFHRRDFGHMDLQITVEDPKMYTRPWTATVPYNLMPDTELIEYVCENEKDLVHMVGK